MKCKVLPVFYLLTGLFLFFLPVRVQGDIFSYPLNQQSMNAFIMTCAQFEHPFVTGNFEQEKILNRLNRSLKSSGNFIIAANLGMVWDTINPVPSALTLGSDYIIQSRPGRRRTVINAQGNEVFLRIAEVVSMIFTGNAQGLIDNFEIFYYGSASSWELGLIPLNSAVHSFAQRITMKGDSAIKNIKIFEQNGDTTEYIMSNHRYPIELSTHEKTFFEIP